MPKMRGRSGVPDDSNAAKAATATNRSTIALLLQVSPRSHRASVSIPRHSFGDRSGRSRAEDAHRMTSAAGRGHRNCSCLASRRGDAMTRSFLLLTLIAVAACGTENPAAPSIAGWQVPVRLAPTEGGAVGIVRPVVVADGLGRAIAVWAEASVPLPHSGDHVRAARFEPGQR